MAMTPLERGFATATNQKVDEFAASPLTGGVLRRLLPGNVTYKEWASDPKLCAQSYIEGFKKWRSPFGVAFTDLSVTAADLGANVRMDKENTPFVDGHIIHDMEDYDKIVCPDVTKGRIGNTLKTTEVCVEELKDQCLVGGFLEGPLLTLSQAAGAERLFMDMFTDSAPVHKALKQTTELCCNAVDKMAETGAKSMTWDYLWGSYSVLGDAEYAEFEGDSYGKQVLKHTRDVGMSPGIHNCADLPHLDTQINKLGVDTYSMAHYPLIEGSPSIVSAIEQGYADRCTLMGDIEPQMFMRNTYEEVYEATKNLCQEVKTALCKRGLNSHVVISTGCEIPPDLETKMENIDAVFAAVHEHGKMN